eukprot:13705307-Ditylum_brightwellii.AAC.1
MAQKRTTISSTSHKFTTTTITTSGANICVYHITSTRDGITSHITDAIQRDHSGSRGILDPQSGCKSEERYVVSAGAAVLFIG